MLQKGIDPTTHKALSEINKDEDKFPNKCNEKASAGSGPIKPMMAAEEFKLPPLDSELYPLSSTTGSKINTPTANSMISTPTKKFFPEKFVDSHENPSTSCSAAAPSLGYFSFQQMSYGSSAAPTPVDPNPAFWFNQHSRLSELNSATVLHPDPTSIQSSQIGFKPGCNVPVWDTGNDSGKSSTNTGSNNSSQMQNNRQIGLDNIIPWGLDNCRSDKESQVQTMDNQAPDMKWSEYLNPPFLVQNQASQLSFSDFKPDLQFGSDGSTVNWPQQPPQQHLQASDIRRLESVFGQY